LAQVKVEDKSNEIEAIPQLLDLMEIEGCIVTIDAMGTQKKIAQRIREGKADYVFALKANQGTLLENVKLYLDDALARNFRDVPYDSHTTVEKDHGRFEKRELGELRVVLAARGQAVRAHWGVENSLHWVLDIAFREDESQIRKDNSYRVHLSPSRHGES
jgi:predicted transposase YbfD/YdcC